jgi:monofunctional biosynthetic peptidoglycan transglycosylase
MRTGIVVLLCITTVLTVPHLSLRSEIARNVEWLRTDNPDTSAYIQRRGSHHVKLKLTWKPMQSLSPILVCAVVDLEDPRFFYHRGFDWVELRKAGAYWIHTGDIAGSSTITQQLARNLFLGPERTIQRKAREAVISYRLERTLSKQRILEVYLNVVEWGQDVWGVTAASRSLFNKDPSELDAFEASFLASLLPAPTVPLQGRNLQRAYIAQRRAVDRLFLSGAIEAQEWNDATQRVIGTYERLASGWPLPAAVIKDELSTYSIERTVLPAVNPIDRERLVAEGCGTKTLVADESILYTHLGH